jgi:hypothetical protein
MRQLLRRNKQSVLLQRAQRDLLAQYHVRVEPGGALPLLDLAGVEEILGRAGAIEQDADLVVLI